ncbi:MAG: helix-turn-helix domain-containing protein [Clostridia bacterium]|nr:helix-turn-helix domain-containing protein [Clostridia bacterium]
MAVFRVEKNHNYTVMSNHHLKNRELSLKAKGLLSQMLSLPDNWDYTLAGLAKINREKVDAIRTAIWELEKFGYITRTQTREANGRMSKTEYIIYEAPQVTSPILENPTTDKPILENPITVNPTSEKSASENPTQLNTNFSNKKELNNDLSITNISNPIQSNPKYNKEKIGLETIEAYREIIKENIDYDILVINNKFEVARIDEIVELMAETVCTSKEYLTIAGDEYPAELVKSKFLKIDAGHIEYVIECLKNNTTDVRNIKKYLLAVLFNAPSTMDSYYSARVNHDMYGG